MSTKPMEVDQLDSGATGSSEEQAEIGLNNYVAVEEISGSGSFDMDAGLGPQNYVDIEMSHLYDNEAGFGPSNGVHVNKRRMWVKKLVTVKTMGGEFKIYKWVKEDPALTGAEGANPRDDDDSGESEAETGYDSDGFKTTITGTSDSSSDEDCGGEGEEREGGGGEKKKTAKVYTELLPVPPEELSEGEERKEMEELPESGFRSALMKYPNDGECYEDIFLGMAGVPTITRIY